MQRSYGKQHARLYAAIMIMCLGAVLAGWKLWPILFPRQTLAETVQRPDSPAEQALGPTILDTPTDTAEAVERAVEAARTSLRDLLQEREPAIVGGARRDDLIEAFVERLEATINAEYERDIAALLARGRAPVPNPPSKQFLDKWAAAKDWTRGVRIGVAGLDVRVILQAGQQIAPSGADEGYETTTLVQRTSSGEHVFGLPEDLHGARLDIVEVRLPMAIRPVHGEDRGAVLVGYQFAWNGGRRQWVPAANVLYKGSGATYAGLGF